MECFENAVQEIQSQLKCKVHIQRGDAPNHDFCWTDNTHIIEYGKHDPELTYKASMLHEHLHALFFEEFPLRVPPNEYDYQSYQPEAMLCKEVREFLDVGLDLFVNTRMMQMCPEETVKWIVKDRDLIIREMSHGMPIGSNPNIDKVIAGFYFAQSARLLNNFQFPHIEDNKIMDVYEFLTTAPLNPGFENLYNIMEHLLGIFEKISINRHITDDHEYWEFRTVVANDLFLGIELFRKQAW